DVIEFNINSGESCCFLVASDRTCVTSHLCVVEHKAHHDHEKDDPQEADRDILTAHVDLKDASEPAAFLSCRRPRDTVTAYNHGAESAGDHTGTQRCQERRQIHQRHQASVDDTEDKSDQDCYKHTYCNRHTVLAYQKASDQ